jgi:hypothetical protein
LQPIQVLAAHLPDPLPILLVLRDQRRLLREPTRVPMQAGRAEGFVLLAFLDGLGPTAVGASDCKRPCERQA